jgi:hypothetical protein
VQEVPRGRGDAIHFQVVSRSSEPKSRRNSPFTSRREVGLPEITTNPNLDGVRNDPRYLDLVMLALQKGPQMASEMLEGPPQII